MRIRTALAGAAVAAPTVAALLLAPAAHAVAGGADKGPKGNNGTVKIHDAETGEYDERNNPKVCHFYLDAFGFDSGQQVIWWIEDSPNKNEGADVLRGVIGADPNGHVVTETTSLPDGHYKLYWVIDGDNGKEPGYNEAKHKVFKVDCSDEPTSPPTTPGGEESPSESVSESASPTGSESPAPSESVSDSGSPTQSESASPTEPVPSTTEPVETPSPGGTAVPGAPDASPSVTPAASASPSDSASPAAAGGDLAETGSSGVLLTGILAVVLLVGGVVLTRMRSARRH